MSGNEPTISVHFVNVVLRNLAEADRAELLARNRIAARLLAEPGARVPALDYANLVRDVMHRLGDETIGYGLVPMRLGCWDAMARSVIGAATLGDALAGLARFYRLLDWGVLPRFADDGTSASFSLDPSPEARALDAYVFESFLFYVHRFAGWLIGREIPLLGVDFCHAEPAYAAEYRRMFPGAPLRFGQPRATIWFASGMALEPLLQTRRTLEEYLDHPNRVMILEYPDRRSLRYRVRALLAADLAFNPTLPQIAARLGLHPQTLRRRLAREGFRYQDLRAEVRRDTAIFLLGTRGLSVEETARLTGFSEASSLIRAFRGWTGLTPYAYRRRG